MLFEIYLRAKNIIFEQILLNRIYRYFNNHTWRMIELSSLYNYPETVEYKRLLHMKKVALYFRTQKNSKIHFVLPIYKERIQSFQVRLESTSHQMCKRHSSSSRYEYEIERKYPCGNFLELYLQKNIMGYVSLPTSWKG